MLVYDLINFLNGSFLTNEEFLADKHLFALLQLYLCLLTRLRDYQVPMTLMEQIRYVLS